MPTSEVQSWRSARWCAAIGAGLDLLLPPVCIACRSRIGNHGLACGACFAKIDFIAPPICERLGVPLRARAVARYFETMRDLMQSFKYSDRQEGLSLFCRWLARAGTELLNDADVIVPVPLYRSRRWWRRFNQSALLAQQLSKRSGVPHDCFVPKARAADGKPGRALGRTAQEKRGGRLPIRSPRVAPPSMARRSSWWMTSSPRARLSRPARGSCDVRRPHAWTAWRWPVPSNPLDS